MIAFEVRRNEEFGVGLITIINSIDKFDTLKMVHFDFSMPVFCFTGVLFLKFSHMLQNQQE